MSHIVGNMEERITRLEASLARFEAKFEATVPYLATKEDIASLKAAVADREVALQRWLIGILMVAFVSMAMAIIKTFT